LQELDLNNNQIATPIPAEIQELQEAIGLSLYY
jgi:hypothetical protein